MDGVISSPGIKDIYYVKTVEKSQYADWLVYRHYAKNIPSVMYSYGLYEKESDKLIGVCCYGTPANNHNNMLGDFQCIELVRLVVEEGLPKNSLSFFVTQTFGLLRPQPKPDVPSPKPLVLVSYADQGKHHCGYIYQATNWIYTGLGGGVDFYRDITGKEIHSRIMSDYRLKWPDKTRDEIAKELQWEKVPGTFKHRYYYFLGNKTEKRAMMKALTDKYKVEPYPKEVNERYDSSEKLKREGLGW